MDKSELKQWVTIFQYDDGSSNKYVVKRENYKQAKDESASLMYEFNEANHGVSIIDFSVNEG